jgi:hypothetical protein
MQAAPISTGGSRIIRKPEPSGSEFAPEERSIRILAAVPQFSFMMTIKNSKRASLAALGCLTLASCATGVNSELAYVPPSMPTMKATATGIKAAAAEAKLTAPLEISDVRETYHGPGRFLLCMRGLEPKSNRVVTYAVFFDNDEYRGLRLPVILDGCETQNYRSFP